MESVVLAAPDASVTDVGKKLHVIPVGRPLHEKTIDPVKFVDDVTFTPTELLAPAFTGSCELANAKEKSLPMPLIETVCGAVSTQARQGGILTGYGTTDMPKALVTLLRFIGGFR
jgi:hypothetical protein